MNDVLKRISDLLNMKHWSKYKLAKKSGIPLSSLNSLFSKNNQPTISTLQKICDGFGITMSEFFIDTVPVFREPQPTKEEKEILSLYNNLGKKEQHIIQVLLREMQDPVIQEYARQNRNEDGI
jgi:transcriptional regulator with XRE-family HTH domain